MTTRVIIPSKPAGDTYEVIFPFQGDLAFGEAVIGANVLVELYAGIDPSPSDILSGLPSDGGSGGKEIHQVVEGGQPGCIYHLTCAGTTSLDNLYLADTYLAIPEEIP